jgi:glycosyltransferase involved in cell wall biosynthesis
LPLEGMIRENVVALDHGGEAPWWRGTRTSLLRSPRPLAKALAEHCKECAEQIRARGFDICMAATDRFFGAPPIARYLQCPSVLYLQEPSRWLYEANPEFPWLTPPHSPVASQRAAYPARVALETVRIHRRGQRARIEVDNAKSFTRILVNSLFSRETVLRVYGIDATVCYLGVDTEHFRPLGIPLENMILGVGILAPHKRAHLLVEAASQCASPQPRVEWIGVAEDAGYAKAVRSHAKAAHVELVVHSNAGDDVLLKALNRAVALVYVPRLEPFGLVSLEASACGTPVVGVAEGGVRETVSDGGTGTLTAADGVALAGAIDLLKGDSAHAAALGAAGRELVLESWTQEAAVDRLEQELIAMVEA